MAGGGNAHAWIARGGALGFFGAAVSALAGFALTILLSRGLGPHGAGVVMQTIAVFSMLMALTKVGMDSTAIFLLPRTRHDNPHALTSHLRFMGAITLSVSTATALALWLLAPHIWDEATPELAHAIRAVAWFLPAGSLVVTSAAAMRALGTMGPYVITHNLALPLLRLAAVASTIAFTGAALTVAVAWALPLLAICAVSVVIVRWHVHTITTRPTVASPHQQAPQPPTPSGAAHPPTPSGAAHPPTPSGVAHPSTPSGAAQRLTHADRLAVISYAAPRTLTAGLEQALVWIDVLLVGYLATAAAAGIYGGASRFIQAGMIVDTALRVVVSPKLSALIHQRRTTELHNIHQTTTMWLILFACPIYVLMGIFSPTVMSLLGPDFLPAAPALAILCAAMSLTFFAGNIHTLLLMSGRSGWAAINKIVVLAINVIGNILFIPIGGITAAALVWAASMIVDAVLATIQVSHCVGVRLHPGIYRAPVGVVALTVALPSAVIAAVWGQGAWQCATATMVSLALYAGACIHWREALALNNLRSPSPTTERG